MEGQKTRRAGIRGDHEFFDGLACAALHLLTDIDLPVTVEYGPGLEGFEFERAVGRLDVVAHLRPIHGGMGNGSVPTNHHFSHDGQPVFMRVERGQVGRQALGQHRKHHAPWCRPTWC